MAKKVAYSRLMADFQENGSAGDRQFLNLGIITGVWSAQAMKTSPNFSRKKRSSAQMILS